MPSRPRATLAGFAAMVVVAGCATTATRPATPTAGPQPLVVSPVPVRVEPRPPTAGPPLDLTDLLALDPDRLFVTTLRWADDGEAGRSRIVETRDSGTTWHELWRGEGVEVTGLARRPDDALIAFVSRSSNDRVVTSWRLTSTDGGRTWQRRRIPPIATNHGRGCAFDVTFVTNRVGSAAAGPTGGGSVPELLTTHDGGLTWIRAAGPDTALAFASARIAVGIGPYPAHPGSAGLLRSTDGGARWRAIRGTRGVDGAVAFSSPTHGLAAGGVWRHAPDDPPARAVLLVTDDAGATWRRRVARYEDSRKGGDGAVPGFPLTRLVSAGPGRWWAITDGCRVAQYDCFGDLLRSDDDGRHWRAVGHAVDVVAGGREAAVELPAADGGIYLPRDRGLLRFTDDAGRTWRKRYLTEGALRNRPVGFP